MVWIIPIRPDVDRLIPAAYTPERLEGKALNSAAPCSVASRLRGEFPIRL